MSKTKEGKYNKIIELEPDDDSFVRLNKYIAQNRMKNVVTSMLGAWNECTDLKFDTGNEQLSSVVSSSDNAGQNSITIYADRLDNLFFEPVTLIKINYFMGWKLFRDEKKYLKIIILKWQSMLDLTYIMLYCFLNMLIL